MKYYALKMQGGRILDSESPFVFLDIVQTVDDSDGPDHVQITSNKKSAIKSKASLEKRFPSNTYTIIEFEV